MYLVTSKDSNLISVGLLRYGLFSSFRKYVGRFNSTLKTLLGYVSAECFRKLKHFDLFGFVSEFSTVCSLSWFIVRTGARPWLLGPWPGFPVGP